MDKEEILNNIRTNKWKNKNKKYLFEVQKFLDLCDNIKDEELKKTIKYQMLKCDKTLTCLSENIFTILMKKKGE